MHQVSSESRWDRAAPWIIVAALVLTFGRVIGNGISPIDDNDNIFRNPRMDSLNPPTLVGPRGVGVYWTHGVEHLYVPLAYTFWTLLAMASWTQTADPNGLRIDPRIFHAASLLLHIANTLLVYSLLRLFLRSRNIQSFWPALAGALLFGLHPLQVETVAWIVATRDLLSGVFSLLSLICYFKAVSTSPLDPPGNRRPKIAFYYIAAILLLILGMLSKPTAVVIPLIAGIIDLLLLRRRFVKVILSIAPYLLAAIPLAIVTRLVQPGAGVPTPPWWERPIVAGASLTFYLGKFFIPTRLAFDYGWRPVDMLTKPWFWAISLVPVLIAAALILLRRRLPWLLAGALIAVVALLPVLGFTPFLFQFYSTVADHYLFLAMIGPAIAFAGLLARNGGAPTPFTVVPAAVLAILFSSLSFMQIGYWHSPEEMLHHMVSVNPDSALALNNLGKIYAIRRDFADAEACFLRTETNPMEIHGSENLALLYAIEGKSDRAIAVLHQLYIVANRYPADARPDLRDFPEQLFSRAVQNHHYLSLVIYAPDIASMWLATHSQPGLDKQVPTLR
jgi:hypothetical protein